MRSQRAYGRPGTAVIPAAWAASHAPVVEGFMTEATVSLRKPGGTQGAFDPDTGTYAFVPFPPFATGVPARVQALTEISVPAADAAGESVRVLGYRVSIPASTPTADLDEGILVDFTECAGDALLEGSSLHVTDIVRGTHRFERDLICDLNT